MYFRGRRQDLSSWYLELRQVQRRQGVGSKNNYRFLKHQALPEKKGKGGWGLWRENCSLWKINDKRLKACQDHGRLSCEEPSLKGTAPFYKMRGGQTRLLTSERWEISFFGCLLFPLLFHLWVLCSWTSEPCSSLL